MAEVTTSCSVAITKLSTMWMSTVRRIGFDWNGQRCRIEYTNGQSSAQKRKFKYGTGASRHQLNSPMFFNSAYT